MKIRNGFIANSSSTSFTITNKSDLKLTLVDFVAENPQLIERFRETYDWNKDLKHSQGNMLASAYGINMTFDPHESKYCLFGDEDGTLVGEVFDYMLREGGESEHFSWQLEEYCR